MYGSAVENLSRMCKASGLRSITTGTKPQVARQGCSIFLQLAVAVRHQDEREPQKKAAEDQGDL